MQPAASSPTLSTGDWGVILLYLVGVIGLGLWLGRGQRNTRDYFLGGRDLPWWGVALSILATETSALTFIGVPAMAYGGHLGFMQLVLGYALGRVLLAAVMVPYYLQPALFQIAREARDFFINIISIFEIMIIVLNHNCSTISNIEIVSADRFWLFRILK